MGVAYNIKRTNTVLRVSYARTLETPFNENLVLSSQGCADARALPAAGLYARRVGTLKPGFRNEFHAGFQQAFGKYAVVSGEYIWKYTHNAFDFSVLGNTPITFPIDWHNSKIPGFALTRQMFPTIHNVSAYVVMSSVAARFFPPQICGSWRDGGRTAVIPSASITMRSYNQTTHLQYNFPAARRTAVGGLQLAL